MKIGKVVVRAARLLRVGHRDVAYPYRRNCLLRSKGAWPIVALTEDGRPWSCAPCSLHLECSSAQSLELSWEAAASPLAIAAAHCTGAKTTKHKSERNSCLTGSG